MDFISRLSFEQLDNLASLVTLKKYKKGETVFDGKDFPLKSFFIVKKGAVDLKKRVMVEQTNYIPAYVNVFERRIKSNTYAHVLGTVKVTEYFGLLESLTNTTE